ncbi:MAG: hypothetical protein HOQ45_24580 [Nocardioidaceae bacterium]|nr:hypothetical protein [Nocardioidaceae bacterium]
MDAPQTAWLFDRLAVTVARVDFLDPARVDDPTARERGVRVELHLIETRYDGSIYVSASRSMRPAFCRIDLLESAPYAADRMHWHPVMTSGEPGDRTMVPEMVADPLAWLTSCLHDVDAVLTGNGIDGSDLHDDVTAVRGCAAEIVACAEQGLAWARVDPWPDVARDDRGLAPAP